MNSIPRKVAALVLALALLASPVLAQGNAAQDASGTLASGGISTAGADCSTSTNCLDMDVRSTASVAVYLTVGVSGTFAWEASEDATSATSGTWFSVSDDVNAAATATSTGIRYFSNPGWRRFRVRASAISGAAIVRAERGVATLRTTATVTASATVASNGTTSAAVPASADYVGINVGGNLVGLTGTGTSANVNITGGLPASPSTSTKQSDGSQKTQIVDGAGAVIASTSNNLNVQCANCSGSGASAADNATVTESTSTFAPAGGEFLTTPGTVTTGHQAMVAMTAHRAFQVSFFDASGNAMLGSKVSANSLPVVIASDQAAIPVSISNGSTTVTEAATITANQSAVAIVDSVAYGFDGTTDSRVRTRAGLIGSSDVAWVVRPFPNSDGTNTTPIMDAAARAGFVIPTAGTTAGATPFYYISGASNNSTNKKASAGTLYSVTVINNTATEKFIRFYDTSSGPTCSSNTGVVYYTPIPANSTTGAGIAIAFPVGAAFSTGISWCITGAAGDSDNTSTAAGDVVLAGSFK